MFFKAFIVLRCVIVVPCGVFNKQINK